MDWQNRLIEISSNRISQFLEIEIETPGIFFAVEKRREMIKKNSSLVANMVATVFVFAFGASLLPLSACGQDSLIDPIEKARTYPPGVMSKNNNELSVAVLNWRLLRLETLIDQSQNNFAEIMGQIKAKSAELEEIVAELPVEHRSLNEEVRSQLAGKVLEQIIDARLDTKTILSSIDALEQSLKEEQQSQHLATKRAQEIAVLAAQKKFEIAKIEAKKIMRLAQKGSKSESESEMAKYVVMIAELELSKAKLDLKNASSAQASELASQLVQKRIEVKAIKARTEAAEELLKSFSSSQKLSEKIAEAKEEIKGWQKDKQIVARELVRLEQQKTELKTLKKMIEAELKKMADAQLEKARKDNDKD